MKILITGGAGFIGSTTTDLLLSKGYEVRVIDNLSTGRLENLNQAMQSEKFTFINGNVTDKALVDEHVSWCDHCYHYAAPVGVKLIMEQPVRTILDNVRGADNVMESVNRYKKRVLMASTSEIYGKNLDLLDDSNARKLVESDYRVEGSTRNHRWAYANTKAMDEFLAFAYHKEFGTEIVIARFFNTVGPRQLFNYGMVIPNFVKRAINNEDVVVFGSGKQKRSFMHVKDAVRAVTQLMITGKGVGEEFNVGNPIEITMNQLAERVIERVGSSSKVIHKSYEEVYGKGFEDMNRRTADISKLVNFIDFEMKYDLDAILDTVIAYYKSKVEA